MKASNPNIAKWALLFIFGMSSLVRFSRGVRLVDVLGLTVGGAVCGAALFGIIFALVPKTRS